MINCAIFWIRVWVKQRSTRLAEKSESIVKLPEWKWLIPWWAMLRRFQCVTSQTVSNCIRHRDIRFSLLGFERTVVGCFETDFASIYSFFSMFEYLQDLQTSAPIYTQNVYRRSSLFSQNLLICSQQFAVGRHVFT